VPVLRLVADMTTNPKQGAAVPPCEGAQG